MSGELAVRGSRDLLAPDAPGNLESAMRLFSRFFAVLILPVVLPLALRAELPPSAYEAMQAKAPEFLEIQVMRVEIEPGENIEDQKISLLARVEKVHRTDTKLQAGDLLTIIYTVTDRPRGWVGPGAVPILNEGDRNVAYLLKGDKPDEFKPAAGAMTFHHF